MMEEYTDREIEKIEEIGRNLSGNDSCVFCISHYIVTRLFYIGAFLQRKAYISMRRSIAAILAVFLFQKRYGEEYEKN